MSARHFLQLEPISEEFAAVRSAVRFALANWPAVASALTPTKLYEMALSADKLESTYIIRLTAAYESITVTELRKPGRRFVREKASGIELTNQLSGWRQDYLKKTPTISRAQVKDLKTKTDRVRALMRYRNKLAHGRHEGPDEFSFRDARRSLNLLLDLIPS